MPKPVVVMTNNILWGDGGRTALHASYETDYEKALEEANTAVVYASPGLVRIHDAVILYGSYKKWFDRYYQFRGWWYRVIRPWLRWFD